MTSSILLLLRYVVDIGKRSPNPNFFDLMIFKFTNYRLKFEYSSRMLFLMAKNREKLNFEY